MALSGTTPHGAHGSEPGWYDEATEQFRARGYVTLSVKIGYDLVLIVSGPEGEAAIVDLTRHEGTLWNDAWAGIATGAAEGSGRGHRSRADRGERAR